MLSEGPREAGEEVDAGSRRGLAWGLIIKVREGAHGKIFECCVLIRRYHLRS